MPSRTGSTADERARHPDPPQRPSRRGRRGGAGGGADRGPPGPRADLARPGHARRRPRDGGVRAPARAGALGQGDQRPVRHHRGRLPRHRSQGGDGGREEAAMTLFWIGSLMLLLIVLPVVILLLSSVLTQARSIVPSVERIASVTAAGSKDLDAVPLLLTTQEQVKTTVEVVAGYGGSLDVIVDDAEEATR